MLTRRLAELGVRAASHFVPLHASPFGRELSGGVALPQTDRLAASVVRLPIYPGLPDAGAHRVVAAVSQALGQ
jgi:dTDP-4-amino-4,6-dideoxygalactose transaminase